MPLATELRVEEASPCGDLPEKCLRQPTMRCQGPASALQAIAPRCNTIAAHIYRWACLVYRKRNARFLLSISEKRKAPRHLPKCFYLVGRQGFEPWTY